MLAAARARGNVTVNGLGLLLNQARPAFNAWFGVMPEITPALLRRPSRLRFSARTGRRRASTLVDPSPSEVFEPKIDCHVHVLDPARFPYRADTHYAPGGPGDRHAGAAPAGDGGVRHAPRAAGRPQFGLRPRQPRACSTRIARGGGRYKGDRGRAQRHRLRRARSTQERGRRRRGVERHALRHRLLPGRGGRSSTSSSTLDMFVDIQVEHDQLLPNSCRCLTKSSVRILVDHCGRPTVDAGLDQPGFRALLELGATRRAYVKLSGFVKFSREPSPHDDVRPFLDALVDAYTLEHCLWASDWPYLRAPCARRLRRAARPRGQALSRRARAARVHVRQRGAAVRLRLRGLQRAHARARGSAAKHACAKAHSTTAGSAGPRRLTREPRP